MNFLDVSCLFTNIPIEETIDICANILFLKYRKSRSFIKNRIEGNFLLQKNPIFIFNGKPYKQIDGVTISSPLAATLVNAFLVYFEKNSLQNCPSDVKPHYYWWNVNDIFLFTWRENLEGLPKFTKWLTCYHIIYE